MLNLLNKKLYILILIPVISLILGFALGEDLSTGGSKADFIRTFPIVVDFSNFEYNKINQYTRHAPFHYFLLSVPQYIFGNIYIVKVLYFLFSLTLPFVLYLNLKKIYKYDKINLLIVAISFLYLPYFRASSIWPNAHLTSLIFLLIANYYYILTSVKKNFLYIFLNIFFLSCATYAMQSYIIFFIYYLLNYFTKNTKKDFLKIMCICFICSIPGFFIILNTQAVSKLEFTSNIYYTLLTNLSITFFFLCFLIFNPKNFKIIKNSLYKIKKREIALIILTFSFLVLNFDYNILRGGGFFYKISNFVLKNNIIFYITAFFGFLTTYLLYKKEKKIIIAIILVNLTAISYNTFQKYFEPLLLITIFTFYKNFLAENILSKTKYALLFYFMLFSYFVIAIVNNYNNFSKNLIVY